MSRHTKDTSETPKKTNRAAALLETKRRQLQQKTRRSLLDHRRPTSGQRTTQFASIERGREV